MLRTALWTLLSLSLAICGGWFVVLDTARAEAPLEAELVLRQGRLLDGSGEPARQGDVAIHEGRIVAVGEALNVVGSARSIDCRHLAIAPGFIDLHNHSDDAIVAPNARNFPTWSSTSSGVAARESSTSA